MLPYGSVQQVAVVSPPDPVPDPAVALAAYRHDLQRAAAVDPLQAGCFATEDYRVGDLGHYNFGPPDPERVKFYSWPQKADTAEIAIERYLGMHEYALHSVAQAAVTDVDRALLDYVRVRKLLLKLLHRYGGEAGLRTMQEAYDTDKDRAVLALVARRLDEGAPALLADRKIENDIKLLLSAPAKFSPCLAQALDPRLATQP